MFLAKTSTRDCRRLYHHQHHMWSVYPVKKPYTLFLPPPASSSRPAKDQWKRFKSNQCLSSHITLAGCVSYIIRFRFDCPGWTSRCRCWEPSTCAKTCNDYGWNELRHTDRRIDMVYNIRRSVGVGQEHVRLLEGRNKKGPAIISLPVFTSTSTSFLRGFIDEDGKSDNQICWWLVEWHFYWPPNKLIETNGMQWTAFNCLWNEYVIGVRLDGWKWMIWKI